MPPKGRRPGKIDTRQAVLDAARPLFAERGYQGTSVRAIAAAAGVDPAMISHHFGGKAALFDAAVEFPLDPADVAAQLGTDPDGIGLRLARVFFGAWERPHSRGPLLAVLRGAATHPESAALTSEFLQGQLYPALSAAVRGPDAELRVDLAMGQLLGIAYLRYVLAVEPVASTPVADLIDRIAPVLDRHLTAE
ncbi:MAG: TetR/AcrR family transcriptional regulator [Mycobacteriaceae bacterium]|nr:TetR/AcrR family transcriptional regulator [Mycobacteriaceae bacterium]